MRITLNPVFQVCLVVLQMMIIPPLAGQGSPELTARIDAYVTPLLAMDAWSGVIIIKEKGKPVFQKAYGMADREWAIPLGLDARFRMASISKVFTEVMVLQLVEAGLLRLDQPLADFMPDYPRGGEITIRQLLAHRAGIPHLNNFSNYDSLSKFTHTIPELIALFRDKPLDFEPGARYRYSNSGYVLLAYLIEQLRGVSYAEALRRFIIEPYDLGDTGIDDFAKVIPHRARGYMYDASGSVVNAEYVDMSIKVGGGNLYSNAQDLIQFEKLLTGGAILKTTLPEMPNFGEEAGQQIFSATGRVQGFCHFLGHWLDEDLQILVLGNHYSNIALTLGSDLYRIIHDQPVVIPVDYRRQQVAVPAEALKPYCGVFDFHFGPIAEVSVNAKGQLCYGVPGNSNPDVLLPLGNDEFFYLQSWVKLHFVRNAQGVFDRLDWIMGDQAYPADRVP